MIREFEVDIYDHVRAMEKKDVPMKRGTVVALVQKVGKTYFLVRTSDGKFIEALVENCKAVIHEPSSKRFKRS